MFGNRPCEAFPTFTTSEFADRFRSTIKAPDESRSVYVKHLALLVGTPIVMLSDNLIQCTLVSEKIC